MKTVLIFSGGLDSTVLLYSLLDQGHTVSALSIDYGQRHARELVAASSIARVAKVPHRVVDASSLRPLLAGSSQTSDVPVPFGHYTDQSMKVTVVPNRNMLMLSIATAWAISLKFDAIAYGAHAGDHAIYPDCRLQFVDAMRAALKLADWSPIELHAPFLSFTKANIVSIGHKLRVPFELTYSCYTGAPVHCGECGTCVERREAFQLAQVLDPTTYVQTRKTIPV